MELRGAKINLKNFQILIAYFEVQNTLTFEISTKFKRLSLIGLTFLTIKIRVL